MSGLEDFRPANQERAKPPRGAARLSGDMPSPPAHSPPSSLSSGASARAPERESGAALILTIIVLTILIVLVVQFAFSVNRETIIVRNTQDDAALELASRGVVPWIRALCQEDRANGAPGGDIDTLGDILFDPNADKGRTLKVGEVTLSFTAEDAERRFPLPWLASGDEKKAEWAKLVLKRLIGKLEIEGDAEALADAITAKVQALAETGKAGPAGAPPAQPGTAPTQGSVETRSLFAITQLLAEPAPAPEAGADPQAGGAAPAGAGDGVERVVLYGIPADEEKGIEGKKGLAAYVTTWDTAGININTVLPEVFWAALPEKDKTRPEDKAKDLWESADEILESFRGHRIDPDFAGGGTKPEGEAPAAEGGAMGATRSWSGKAFEKVEDLESSEIHAKLGAIFTPRQAEGTTAEGEGGAPTPTTGGEGASGGGEGATAGEEEEGFGLKKALVVKSRIYLIRVEASLSADVQNTYRIVLSRNDKDEVRALLIEEAPQ